MEETKSICLVITTCESKEKAEQLARLLLKERLAGCVQVTGVTSYYWWERKINNDKEMVLWIKTKVELYRELEKFLLLHHSYEIPEIIMIPIKDGFGGYIQWLGSVTRNRGIGG
ncbi:MAG: divalent-cation tolerance protein CutA [Syntrophales bacterium]|jgi:periplasmic divalent cation tolerance protein|nr:divalent-cation tolerance protein CutA [Syntrophales bacterium]MDY0045420.1 divalent-cation tolerance protein CutA [Syntrophales bacterium]